MVHTRLSSAYVKLGHLTTHRLEEMSHLLCQIASYRAMLTMFLLQVWGTGRPCRRGFRRRRCQTAGRTGSRGRRGSFATPLLPPTYKFAPDVFPPCSFSQHLHWWWWIVPSPNSHPLRANLISLSCNVFRNTEHLSAKRFDFNVEVYWSEMITYYCQTTKKKLKKYKMPAPPISLV